MILGSLTSGLDEGFVFFAALGQNSERTYLDQVNFPGAVFLDSFADNFHALINERGDFIQLRQIR